MAPHPSFAVAIFAAADVRAWRLRGGDQRPADRGMTGLCGTVGERFTRFGTVLVDVDEEANLTF